jgi:hypothetical protein
MSPSVQLGVRFGFAAAVTVAIVMLSAGLLSLESYVPSAGPSLLSGVALIAGATFIWSYMTSAGTASALAGIERVPPAKTFAAGVLFAILTPAVGYAAFRMTDNAIAVITMLVWVVAWPAASIVMLWRRSRPNTSFERTREG